ncbi:MAG: hypothetical protein K8T10_01155 [Candidatus Eremiobacteraeota bacterium]|nr:hypothetical protein [Candidatus Eremiobacteraeota bacterium]
MVFWKKEEKLPESWVPITLAELDNILTVLRYWYGVEVDHWINSEASRYRTIMRITNFGKKKDCERLFDYFDEAQIEASNLNESTDPLDQSEFDGIFGDFLGVEPTILDGHEKEDRAGVLEVTKLVSSCKVHYPVKNWFFFTDEKRYYRCEISITLSFQSFGEEAGWNDATIKLRILGEDRLAIVGFHSTHKDFDNDFHFLKDGINVLDEIDMRIAKKYLTGKRPEKSSPRKPDWFLFACDSEEEAIILNGINNTLEIESCQKGKKVEFKMDEFDIPGLISYVRTGLPHFIFSK